MNKLQLSGNTWCWITRIASILNRQRSGTFPAHFSDEFARLENNSTLGESAY